MYFFKNRRWHATDFGVGKCGLVTRPEEKNATAQDESYLPEGAVHCRLCTHAEDESADIQDEIDAEAFEKEQTVSQ
jgi:hypothetical protein